MSKTAILITIAVGISVIAVILVSVLVINMKKSKKSSGDLKTPVKEDKEKITIEEMLKIAKDKNSSKEELTKAVVNVAKKLSFPPKVGKNTIGKEAKKYLDFVFLISAHPNSDAQLIAFMDKELKAKNPSYKMEIDVYEDRGVSGRIKKMAV